jgi:hypothetical protein
MVIQKKIETTHQNSQQQYHGAVPTGNKDVILNVNSGNHSKDDNDNDGCGGDEDVFDFDHQSLEMAMRELEAEEDAERDSMAGARLASEKMIYLSKVAFVIVLLILLILLYFLMLMRSVCLSVFLLVGDWERK